MTFHQLVEAFVLGNVLADDLPISALQAIHSGSDSPAVYEMADSQGLDAEHLRKLFFKAAEELGVVLPSEQSAALSSARRIAREVVEQRVTPYRGAKRIWSELCTRFPEIAQLRPFIGLASEYEDDEAHREEYSAMIVDECMTLLQTVNPIE